MIGLADAGGGTVELEALRHLRLEEQVDLEEVLRLVVDEVVALLDADRGTLYLVDHARGELVSRVAHLPEMSEIRLGVGEGVAGWVARTGRRVSVPDGTFDARHTPRIDLQTGYTTRTLLAVPVRDDEETLIGVLQVLNKRVGAFDEGDAARLEALAGQVARVLAATSLRSQLRPDHPRSLEFRFNHIVGESPAMREVFRRIARAARTDATVLVRGESGTGKEVISRAVHVNSPRREGPFVKVDCAALPEQLIENELFGHERGAFTGADRTTEGKVEQANGGTLFLDEVGELPLTVQGKLLRLLQEKTYLRVGGAKPRQVDVRFVCATWRDLEADVAAGRFRQDLYYRLRVVQIDIPPLRSRGAADLDRLIDHFFFEHTRRHDRPELYLSRAARAVLHAHDWPGNVRELEHCIESAVVLAPGPEVGREHLSIGPITLVELPGVRAGDPDRFVSDLKPLRDVERAYVEHVLALCDGNQSEAARRLEIGRNTLARKLRGE
ncbi:MAG: sigma-54-dependent Fis family transcriptional regulator [Myxococcales bacterium]|nr:sigma-54-dependent Fis family transcriptional regulator [Myxococcales bacterium]